MRGVHDGLRRHTVAARVLVVATVWYALREIASTERAMEIEYQRSEALLADILPASIAEGRASYTSPAEDLEKVKTSGVPEVRADHLEALACLALDMADAVAVDVASRIEATDVESAAKGQGQGCRAHLVPDGPTIPARLTRPSATS
jgi:hypothetical protein